MRTITALTLAAAAVSTFLTGISAVTLAYDGLSVVLIITSAVHTILRDWRR